MKMRYGVRTGGYAFNKTQYKNCYNDGSRSTEFCWLSSRRKALALAKAAVKAGVKGVEIYAEPWNYTTTGEEQYTTDKDGVICIK